MTEVRRVGRYEPVMSIGSGGMATVYLARALVAGDVGREVALKLVHPHLRESEDAASTLLEEAKLAARIRHPNVVAVREVGEDGAGIYLVMDYVEGATLSQLVRTSAQRGEPVPLPIAARILSDALAGLHAAHELTADDGAALHLVHRDFSPQNVLVGLDGVTRLTDFGIAKAASRAGVTSTGVVKGKVGYLSPEQALGKALDRRSDVWAAGVVAWELLSAQRLYDSDAEPVSTMMRIVSEAPPRLSSVRPELSPLLDQTIATALTLDRERRWPSAGELSRALTEAFRAHGGVAEPEEVGDWVRGLVGAELEERRTLYRLKTAPPVSAPERKPGSRALRLSLAAVAATGLGAVVWTITAAATDRGAPPSAAPVAPRIEPANAEPAVATMQTVASSDAGSAESRPVRATSTSRAARARPKSGERMPALGPNPYRKP